jgi:hypothetical protein
MEPIKNLFGNLQKPPQKTRRTERGELLEYFHFNVNLSATERNTPRCQSVLLRGSFKD